MLQARRQVLGWAAELAEIGRSISHEGAHRHSAYILGQSDMPGFSRDEQAALATLALAQSGSLRRLRGLIADDLGWLEVVALRVATILHRGRGAQPVPMPALFLQRRSLRREMPREWARHFPLAHESLAGEAATWSKARVFGKFVYETR